MNKVIHGAVRRDLRRLLDALERFPKGSRVRAEQLATSWANLVDQLTRHHKGEHEIAWPALQSVGVGTDVLTQLDEEHDRLAEALASSGQAIAALRESASTVDAAAREAIATLQMVAVGHFGHEEAELEPIYLANRDDPAIKAMGRRFARTSPVAAGTFFAWVTDAATSEELAAVRKNVPGPVLAIIGAVFGRRYRRQVATVWQ